MHRIFDLPALGIIASYYIRVLAAYLICLAVSSTCFRPRGRFLVWLSFLISSGLYWVFLVVQGFGSVAALGTVATGKPQQMPALLVRLPSWDVRPEWSHAVGLATTALICGYGIGLAIFLLVMLKKRIQLRLLLRRATAVSPELSGIFDKLCRQLGVARCRICVLPGLTSPATAYSWHPQIMVPELLESYLNVAQLEDVLTHELMHVDHRDYLWATASELIRCLLFFHPTIWLALGNLNRERELACDAAVVQRRQDRRPDYAECLTRLARVRLAEERTRAAIYLATSGSFLALRVRTLLAENNRRSRWKRGASFSASIVLLGTLAILWPGLTVLLQYGPPVIAATLGTGRHSSSARHPSHRHRRIRATNRRATRPAVIPFQVPSQIDRSLSRAHLAASAADVPSFSTPVNSTFHRKTDVAHRVDSSAIGNPASVSTPTISQGPVWTESPPTNLPGPPTTLATTAIRVAATIGRVAAGAGGEGQNQEGNHFVPFHGTH